MLWQLSACYREKFMIKKYQKILSFSLSIVLLVKKPKKYRGRGKKEEKFLMWSQVIFNMRVNEVNEDNKEWKKFVVFHHLTNQKFCTIQFYLHFEKLHQIKYGFYANLSRLIRDEDILIKNNQLSLPFGCNWADRIQNMFQFHTKEASR